MRTLLCFAVYLGFSVVTKAEVYYPKGGIKPSKGKVRIENVNLVTDQDVIGRNTTASELVVLIRAIEARVAAAVPADAAPFPLRVRATLSPRSKPQIKLSYQQTPPRQMLQAISDRLKKIPDLRTKTDSVVFEIYFEIRKKA